MLFGMDPTLVKPLAKAMADMAAEAVNAVENLESADAIAGFGSLIDFVQSEKELVSALSTILESAKGFLWNRGATLGYQAGAAVTVPFGYLW